MGTIVRFPGRGRAARIRGSKAGSSDSATVIILPVIRIERYSDEPAEQESSRSQRRRRRRRASRS
jgi:hypothetical protein